MGRKDDLFAGIMVFSIISIILLIAYFCLDIFGIIEVPNKFSLVKLLASNTEEVSVAKPIDEIVTEDNIDEWINNQSSDNHGGEEDEVEDIEYQYPIITPNNNSYVPEPETQVFSDNSKYVVNRMYYSQLDLYGKIIYEKMYDHIEDLKTGVYTVEFGTQFNDLLHEENGDQVLENAFQFGINALLFDHPEIFFLNITKIYMSTEITSFGPLKTYRVSIGSIEGESYLADTFKSKQTVDTVQEMLEINRSNVLNSIIQEGEYEKIKAVHDYIIDNVEYDSSLEEPNIYNIYGAIISNKAVCEGYSKAFKYFMDRLEIPCIIVCGIAQNSNGVTENHAWNYVKLEDNWYAIDCTWDDPVIIGNGYVSPEVYKKYFLKGANEFFVDHVEDGRIVEGSKFVYPSISQNSY